MFHLLIFLCLYKESNLRGGSDGAKPLVFLMFFEISKPLFVFKDGPLIFFITDTLRLGLVAFSNWRVSWPRPCVHHDSHPRTGIRGRLVEGGRSREARSWIPSYFLSALQLITYPILLFCFIFHVFRQLSFNQPQNGGEGAPAAPPACDCFATAPGTWWPSCINASMRDRAPMVLCRVPHCRHPCTRF